MKGRASYCGVAVITLCFVFKCSTGIPVDRGKEIDKGEILNSIKVMQADIEELRERVTQLEIKGAAKKDLVSALLDTVKHNNQYRGKRGK